MFLGFDISTKKIGIACLDANDEIHYLNIVDFKDTTLTLEERALCFKDFLSKSKIGEIKPFQVYVEKPLIMMGSNSSAHTLAKLIRFNGMISYILAEHYKQLPFEINATSARSKCGIKIPRDGKKRTYFQRKEPIIRWVEEHYMDTPTPFVYEKTPAGNPTEGIDDMADAIVLIVGGRKISGF